MNPLHAHLAALRRRLRLVVSFRGVCWSLTVIVFACAAAGLLDLKFHLPSLIRALLLVGTLTASGMVAYRGLFRPLLVKTDDLSLALRVEEAYPNLNDSLASAVQFLEQSKRGSAVAAGNMESSFLRLEAVRRTMRQLDGVDFRRAISARGAGPAGVMFGCAIALGAVLVLANPVLALTALHRLALPFSGKDWPRQTQILEVAYKARAPRGDAYVIGARLNGIIPESATIIFEGITPSRQTYYVRRGREANAGELQARLDRVEHSFRFRIEANDAVTTTYDVTVLPPPVLVPLGKKASPQVSLRFPAYTDLPPVELPDGNGNIEAVVGTRVHLRAAVDRPIARAWIEFHPDQALAHLAARLGFLSNRDAGGMLTQTVAVNRIIERVPADLSDAGRVIDVDFVPCVRGMYALRFEDDTGLGNTRLFDLRLMPDPAPTVVLDRPSPARDSLSLLPDAEITLRITAQDPQFAVRSAFLSYRSKRGNGDPGPARRRVLYDHRRSGIALPQLMSLLAATPIPIPTDALRLRPTRIHSSGRLPLQSLIGPDVTPLREGDIVILQACADDFDDISPFKEPGASTEIELHIIGRAQLDAHLNRAQTQVQEELLRLQKEQRDALARVIAAEQRWRNTGKLKPEDVDQLLQAEQQQQQIRGRVGDKKEGLRAEVARILQSLKDNKLPRAGVHDRMENVAGELDRLAREHLEQIEPKLTNARKENEGNREAKPPKRDEKGELGEARRHQEEVENTFTELLKQLEPWGSISAVKSETRGLLQEQRKLQEDVKKADKEGTLGKKPEDLTPEQRAALDRAAELQRKLSERTGQLLEKIQRAANERREKEPELANALDEAFKKGQQAGVQDKMREAGKKVRENKLGEAGSNQKDAAKALEEMANSLDERREQELDRLRKKLAEADKKLDDIAKEQEELRKKTKEARQIADPKKREKELKALKERQEQLRKKAQELARELKELRNERAAKAGQKLEDAAEQMSQAGKKLEDNGEDPDQEQEEALNRLNDAREKLDQAQDKVEDELAREKLAKIADQLKGLRERQESNLAEGDRLRQRVLQKQKWDRSTLSSLKPLSDAQRDLGDETEKLAQEKLKGAKVFAHLLVRSADAMKQAADRIDKLRDQARAKPSEHLTDAETARLQREALRRLDQLLEALKQDQGQAGGGGAPPPGGPAGPAGAGGAPQDGIPALAQLKALRSLQREVNERTESFGKDHPDGNKLTPEEQRELLRIRKEQRDVADLLDEVSSGGDEPDDAAPKKEPEKQPGDQK